MGLIALQGNIAWLCTLSLVLKRSFSFQPTLEAAEQKYTIDDCGQWIPDVSDSEQILDEIVTDLDEQRETEKISPTLFTGIDHFPSPLHVLRFHVLFSSLKNHF